MSQVRLGMAESHGWAPSTVPTLSVSQVGSTAMIGVYEIKEGRVFQIVHMTAGRRVPCTGLGCQHSFHKALTGNGSPAARIAGSSQERE